MIRKLQQLIIENRYQRNTPAAILFDHLPKCAGSTLTSYLLKQYPRRLTFQINGHQTHQSVRKFCDSPQDQRHQYSLIVGHFAHQTIDYARPDMLRATYLRHPVDRIVSHYYFVKSQPHHYLHQAVMEQNMSLEDYAFSGISSELENHYTAHFSNLTPDQVKAAPQAALEKAFHSLSNDYHVVGFQDQYTAGVEALRKAAGLKLPFRNTQHNRNKRRTASDDIPIAARKAIRQTNAIDIELFELLKRHRRDGLYRAPQAAAA